MKKLHLLFAGAFAALAIVACSDDELETETTTETETETDEENTGDENTDEENTGEEEEAPQAYITLSEAELQFGKEGGETTVTVETNYDWDCEYESDWFTVVADTNAGTITVSCDANETGEVREGAVMVTAGDGEENVAEATLAITQSIYEADALVLEYTITSDETTIQLPLGEKAYADDNEYSVDCTVDWGDGSDVETVTGSFPSHTYSEAGIYTVIINGKVELLCSYDYDNGKDINGVDCLTAVKQWGDTGLNSMYRAFSDCTNLASLPEGAGPFSNVTSFYCAFYLCESLTTFPEGMFSDCTAAKDFEWAFSGCYSLISAPSFKGLSNTTDFWYAFWYCTSLTTLPEDMFSGCTAVERFGGVFDYCTSLTSVPENLFANCPSVVDFEYAFAYCTSLTTVPENLFANCPSVLYFDGVLDECASLETVPVGIFDNNKLVEWFEYAFYDCPKLVGESPYTEIEGNKVHLYERENYSEYFTAPTYYSYCFTRCTGLDDYYSIPSSWGGGASTNSITPQSLNATDREERSPSHLGPQRAATGPHRDAPTPQGRAARPHSTRK